MTLQDYKIKNIENLSLQETGFLVNYFGDRHFQWGIHDNVKERFPEIKKNLEALISFGYLKKLSNMYALTESGKQVRKFFRLQEKERWAASKSKLMEKAISGDYLGAYSERAKYEMESILPHSIGMDWSDQEEISRLSSVYVRYSKKLDLSDCMNTEIFKQTLRNLYIGCEIAGTHPMRENVTMGLEEKIGEYLDCPELDYELSQKCVRPNPPKLLIYFNTKILELTIKNIGGRMGWKEKYNLGTYDCTDPYHMAIAEFEVYKQLGIEGFPKTFKTYWKHREEKSEKFKNWMENCPPLKIPI